MLGGGKFTAFNKKLPGTYINFVSSKRATPGLGSRGIAAVALNMNWGNDTDIFEIGIDEFNKNSLKILGYDYSADELKNIREIFRNAQKLYIYRLNNGGAKAQNIYATAKYSGTRGNALKVIIAKNIDNDDKYDVSLYLGNVLVDKQTVANANELVDNDFVVYKKNANLNTSAGVPLEGGTNGETTNQSHQNFIDKLESYDFNALCCSSKESTIQSLYINFTKRMRDDVGVKFQTIVYNQAADHEGIVNVASDTDDADNVNGLVYWVTGVIAGCEINKSNTNKVYDGEYEIVTSLTQKELEVSLEEGKFVCHKVGEEIRVLEDINSLITLTDEKGEDFKNNQTIRVIDQLATDVASLFNEKYLGLVSNNASGRVSLWNDIVTLYKNYYQMQAIENFESNEITVEQGDDKKTVVVNGNITPLNCMSKLYMTILVS